MEEQPRPTSGARPTVRLRQRAGVPKGTESWWSKRSNRDADIEVWRCWKSNQDPPSLVVREEAEMVKAKMPRAITRLGESQEAEGMPRSSPTTPGELIRCERKLRWSPAKPGEPITLIYLFIFFY